MKSTKNQRVLEKKKERLESQIAAAEKVLAEAPEITTEVGRIISKLSTADAHNFADFVDGLDLKRAPSLSGTERQLLKTWYGLIYGLAVDQHNLQETNSLLNPRKGPSNKELDRRQRAAIDERTNGSELTLQQLAIKYSGLNDRQEQKRWAENLRKTIKRSGPSITKRK